MAKAKKRNRDRKAFLYVVQRSDGELGARVNRIKRNRTVFLGYLEFTKVSATIEDDRGCVIAWLKKKEHIKPNHEIGRDFIISTA